MRSWFPVRFLYPLGGVLILILVGLVGYQAGARSIASGTSVVPDHLVAAPVDVGFAADMIDHHDQAVQISLLAIDKASTSAVRTLALEIATSQRRESGMLLQFLHDRGVGPSDPNRTVMAWMNEPTPHDRMPGFATNQQILDLTNASGADVDRIFVELMTVHHQGGVHMAQFAMDHAEARDLRDLASRMIVDQKREIGEMQQLQTP